MSSNGAATSPRLCIQAEIARLKAELTRLEAALQVLEGDEVPEVAAPEPTRTRLGVLADIVRTSGPDGLTRPEAIKQMQRVCNSTDASVCTMLTTLKANGTIKHRGRRWYA